MKNTLKILLIIVLSIKSMHVHTQTIQPAQLKADFKILRESIEQLHPELYYYTSKDSLDLVFNNLESQLNTPMSQLEFYKAVRPLIASIKDGHLKWIVKGADQYYPFYTSNLFPLKLYYDGENVTITKHCADSTDTIKGQIVKINNIPIQTIITQITSNLSFGDGYTQTGKRYELNRFFSALLATEYGTSESYDVEVMHDGKITTWTGKGIDKKEVENAYPSNDLPLSYSVHNDSIAIIKINRFYSYKHEKDFKKALKEYFDAIQESKINQLILDLRGNEGGFEKFGIDLYRHIAKNNFRYYDYISVNKEPKFDHEVRTSFLFKVLNTFSKNKGTYHQFVFTPGQKRIKPYKNNYTGKVLILLDGQSFSVTTEFAARCQIDQRAYFVGEESSGGSFVNSSGFFSIVTLPNAQIDLGIPRLGFRMAGSNNIMNPKRGIIPNYIIIPSAVDVLTNQDSVLEKALEWLGKSSRFSKRGS